MTMDTRGSMPMDREPSMDEMVESDVDPTIGAASNPMEDLVVDGNAVGGLLAAIFGADMTAVPGRCANCHTVNMLGAMRAFTRAPGTVLRCPACGEVVIRLVETTRTMYVDVRGVSYFAFERSTEGR
jgi:hypothetical protein